MCYCETGVGLRISRAFPFFHQPSDISHPISAINHLPTSPSSHTTERRQPPRRKLPPFVLLAVLRRRSGRGGGFQSEHREALLEDDVAGDALLGEAVEVGLEPVAKDHVLPDESIYGVVVAVALQA